MVTNHQEIRFPVFFETVGKTFDVFPAAITLDPVFASPYHVVGSAPVPTFARHRSHAVSLSSG